MPGPMVALCGKLYLFPQDQTNLRWNAAEGTNGDASCAYHDLWCYDPTAPTDKSWTRCASLPQSMTYVSAVADGDTLMVCATNDKGVFLLRYDPASNTWSPLTAASKLPENASLVRMGKNILVVGENNTGSGSAAALSVRQKRAALQILRHEQRRDCLKEKHAVFPRGVEHLLHLCGRDGGGLFHDDVLARPHRAARLLRVEAVGMVPSPSAKRTVT